MKIFVTGGTGFIGKHLVKKLREKKHSLLLLSQQPVEGFDFVEGDLSDINQWKAGVKKFKPDAAVHLAWEGLPDYSVLNSRKNINYGLDLFSFLAGIRCKIVLAVGSAWEYGGRQPETAVAGTMLAKPSDTFSAAKWIVNLWGTALVEENNKECSSQDKSRFIWARILFVYGPGQRETSLVAYLINCWKKNIRPEIKNPSAKNDFIYIDDVVEALIMLLENCKKSGEYDIGCGKLIGTQEIINIIAEKLKVRDWFKDVNQLNDVYSIPSPVADVSRIKEEIGWEPRINIEEGIQKMIDYYLSKNGTVE